MHRSLRLYLVSATLCGLSAGSLLRADDAAAVESTAEPAAAPAADGTTSVVVPTTAPDALPASPPEGLEQLEPPTPGTPLAPPRPPGIDDAPTDAPVPPPGGAAADLLASVLKGHEPAAAGDQDPRMRPLALLEALQRPGDPSRRLWIAQAYWKVSAAHGWVRWATEAVERLDLVAPGSDPHDRAVLDVASAAARADLAEARSQLGVAQQELVDLARLPITDPLPWPVDHPLATPYQTHFDAIFATRIATGRTRAIARTLPARHEALEARAAAVIAAGRAMVMAEADHAQGRRPIEAVVAAHAALVGQQREFLAAVRAYNLDIAEYAMAVADIAVPDDRFVSMLIGTPVAAQPPAAAPAAAGAGLTPPGTVIGGGGPIP